MKKIRIFWNACIVMSIIAGLSSPLYAQTNRFNDLKMKIPLKTKKQMASTPSVTSAIPAMTQIQIAGKAAEILLHGRDLQMVTAAQLVFDNLPVKGVRVSLDRPMGTDSRTITVQADANAIAISNTVLQLRAATNTVSVPLEVLRVDVVKKRMGQIAKEAAPSMDREIKKGHVRPEYFGTLGDCMPPPADYQPPYISSYTPRKTGMLGTEIAFIGQNIETEFFIAKVGNIHLTITSRSSTEIKARLPNRRVVGDLIVGYCSASTDYVLETNYVVHGEPQIYSVTPSAFFRGDLVTVEGRDLHYAGHLQGSAFELVRSDPDRYESILLHDTRSDAILRDNQIVITDLDWNEDGTVFSFRVKRALNNTNSLSGKLRLIRADAYGATEIYTVVSPQRVTYEAMAPLSFTSFGIGDGGFYGGYNAPEGNFFDGANFIVLRVSQRHNGVNWNTPIYLYGRGMYPLTMSARMGGIDLITSHGDYYNDYNRESYAGSELWDGKSMRLYFPDQVTSGSITITRNTNESVQTPHLTILRQPKFQPMTLDMMGDVFEIELNTEYTLRGWYLTPGGVSGLTYQFMLSFITQPFLNLEILQHDENMIRFRVNSVGEIPLNSQAWQQYLQSDPIRQLQLVAHRNGGQKTLFENGFVKYILKLSGN